jgi:hypothetical protein
MLTVFATVTYQTVIFHTVLRQIINVILCNRLKLKPSVRVLRRGEVEDHDNDRQTLSCTYNIRRGCANSGAREVRNFKQVR